MTQYQAPPRNSKKREELSLKQKTYIGIGLFVLLTVLTFQVFIPMYSRYQGQRMAEEINRVITDDHFELMEAERQGIQFFSSFQSTKYKDLYLSTDMAPSDLTPNRISYIYERALEEKPGTMMRFTMSTDDILYDALKSELGDKLLRVIGRFAPGSADLVELDEPFVLGKLPGYVPTVDIHDQASDEQFLKLAPAIMEKLKGQDFNHAGLSIQFTEDRKNAVIYQWSPADPTGDPLTQARADLARLRAGESVEELTITEDIYYDYSYNHNFTLPEVQ